MIIVRRYHLALTHAYGIGTQACMDEAEDGFYVQHSEHLAEVRQTQRRMIAALYWRAGECVMEFDRLTDLLSHPENRWIAVSMMEAAQRDNAEAISLGRAACAMSRVMEAAL